MSWLIWKFIGKRFFKDDEDVETMRERLSDKQEELRKLETEIHLGKHEVDVTEDLTKADEEKKEVTDTLTDLDSKRHKKST